MSIYSSKVHPTLTAVSRVDNGAPPSATAGVFFVHTYTSWPRDYNNSDDTKK